MTATRTSLHGGRVQHVPADREAASVGMEVDGRFVNFEAAGNHSRAASQQGSCGLQPSNRSRNKATSPLPPWDNVYFREPFLFLLRVTSPPRGHPLDDPGSSPRLFVLEPARRRRKVRGTAGCLDEPCSQKAPSTVAATRQLPVCHVAGPPIHRALFVRATVRDGAPGSLPARRDTFPATELTCWLRRRTCY